MTTHKDLIPFTVRTELYAPTRLTPPVYEVFRTRAVVLDAIAHQCWLLVLRLAQVHHQTRGMLPRVGILGGGNVGCAVAMTLLQQQYPADRIAISTRQPERVPKCDALASAQCQQWFQSLPHYYDNARLSRESDILILCMPPSQLKSVAIQIKHALSIPETPTVVISTLCGTPVDTVIKTCGARLVLRTCVNVPELQRLVLPPPDGDDQDLCSTPRETDPTRVAALASQQLGDQSLSVVAELTLRLDPHHRPQTSETASREDVLPLDRSDEETPSPLPDHVSRWHETWSTELRLSSVSGMAPFSSSTVSPAIPGPPAIEKAT